MAYSSADVFVLTAQPSAASVLMAALRDAELQTDPDRFRAHTRRLGAMLAFEVSKRLAYEPIQTQTSLGQAAGLAFVRQPVLATVLRAGLPFYNGFQDVFPLAPSGFIGAYRGAYKEDHSFSIELDYVAAPSLEGQDLLLIDPMLATGKSLVRSVEALAAHGRLGSLHICTLIAAEPGLAYVREHLPEAHLYACAVDPALNGDHYITPGLGDAGDLSFGVKM